MTCPSLNASSSRQSNHSLRKTVKAKEIRSKETRREFKRLYQSGGSLNFNECAFLAKTPKPWSRPSRECSSGAVCKRDREKTKEGDSRACTQTQSCKKKLCQHPPCQAKQMRRTWSANTVTPSVLFTRKVTQLVSTTRAESMSHRSGSKARKRRQTNVVLKR